MKSKESFKNIYFLSGGGGASTSRDPSSSHAGTSTSVGPWGVKKSEKDTTSNSSSYGSFALGTASKHARGFDSFAGASGTSSDVTKASGSGRKDGSNSSSHNPFGTSVFWGSEYKDEKQKQYGRFDQTKAPKEKSQRSGFTATWNKYVKKDDDTERLLKDD